MTSIPFFIGISRSSITSSSSLMTYCCRNSSPFSKVSSFAGNCSCSNTFSTIRCIFSTAILSSSQIDICNIISSPTLANIYERRTSCLLHKSQSFPPSFPQDFSQSAALFHVMLYSLCLYANHCFSIVLTDQYYFL